MAAALLGPAGNRLQVLVQQDPLAFQGLIALLFH